MEPGPPRLGSSGLYGPCAQVWGLSRAWTLPYGMSQDERPGLKEPLPGPDSERPSRADEGVSKMEATEPITITIKLSKETKNTYRYDAVEEDAAVSNLSIQKKALPGGAPPELEIRLTAK